METFADHLRRRAEADDLDLEAVREMAASPSGAAELFALLRKACLDRRRAANEIERLAGAEKQAFLDGYEAGTDDSTSFDWGERQKHGGTGESAWARRQAEDGGRTLAPPGPA